MAERFRTIFPATKKPLIAMAHLPALPGTPLYDSDGGLAAIIRQVRADVDTLVGAGFDAVLFCNENDRPYQLRAGLEAAASMARVVTECRPESLPFGVDYLWDARCGLAVGAATGAAFVRCVATGSWESDMGFWGGEAAWLLRERRRLDVEEMAIFMNATPEFASSIGARPAAQIARSVAVSSLPDAVLISGPMAGAEPDISLVADIRELLHGEVPVLLNTGARAQTIAACLEHADGCIVGSDLKVDGYTFNRIDPARAEQFVSAARGG